MAQGIVVGGGSSTAAGAGASTTADSNPGTAEGGQGGAGDGSLARLAVGSRHGAAMQHSPVSSVAGAGHGDATGGAGHGWAAGSAARLGVDAGLGHGAAADLEGMDPNSYYVLKIRFLGDPKNLEKSPLHYQPRYLEVAHVHYYDEVLKISRNKLDQEFMYMLEKHAKSKMVLSLSIIAICISNPNHNTYQDDDSYLRNPIPENEHVGIDEENMYLKEEPKALNVTMLLMVRMRMRVRMRVRMRARTRLK
ncbi:hypothetical protein VPH35_029713 [Triticum aestivum]